ncbi:MAG: VRR-NUC domain-containing protein [Treponema sp.]|nr:VRR-NUC domain-containing protein [Treponema sp.]
MVIPESHILKGCLHYLEARGIYHWRNNTGAVRIGPGRFMRFGKVGSSDILGILRGGRFLCVECKAPNGRLSPEQKQFLDDIRGLGGLALVVRSWQELDRALREAGYIGDGPLFEEGKNAVYSV